MPEPCGPETWEEESEETTPVSTRPGSFGEWVQGACGNSVSPPLSDPGAVYRIPLRHFYTKIQNSPHKLPLSLWIRCQNNINNLFRSSGSGD